MSREIIKNPGDLPIIENPNKIHRTMAKSTQSKAIDQFSQQAKTALYILGGQALAAQVNGIVVPMALKNQSSTAQQVARAGVPLATGVLLALTVKNKYVRGLSLGFGTQGVLEAIKLVMPNFNPSEGLGDGSHFVYQDGQGNMKRAVVTPDGQVVTQDGTAMLPSAGQSNTQKHSQSMADNQLGDWPSMEMETI